MTNKSCTFCMLYNAEIGILYENEFWWAQLDSFPVVPGHTEVIPKRHIADFSELDENEQSSLHQAISDTLCRIKSTDLISQYERIIGNPLNEASKRLAQICLDDLTIRGHPFKNTVEYNLGLNNGANAGRTIDHLHWHILPRIKGDVPFPQGGVRCVPHADRYNYKITI